MKGFLVETTSSHGWVYIKRFAETVVRDMETKAINEEDDNKANGLRRDARGARLFMKDLFKRIDLAKQIEAAVEDSFLDIATD